MILQNLWDNEPINCDIDMRADNGTGSKFVSASKFGNKFDFAIRNSFL